MILRGIKIYGSIALRQMCMIVPGMVNDRLYIRNVDLRLRTDPLFLQYRVG